MALLGAAGDITCQGTLCRSANIQAGYIAKERTAAACMISVTAGRPAFEATDDVGDEVEPTNAQDPALALHVERP